MKKKILSFIKNDHRVIFGVGLLVLIGTLFSLADIWWAGSSNNWSWVKLDAGYSTWVYYLDKATCFVFWNSWSSSIFIPNFKSIEWTAITTQINRPNYLHATDQTTSCSSTLGACNGWWASDAYTWSCDGSNRQYSWHCTNTCTANVSCNQVGSTCSNENPVCDYANEGCDPWTFAEDSCSVTNTHYRTCTLSGNTIGCSLDNTSCTPNWCFVVWTKVTLVNGVLVPIETVKVGDILLGEHWSHNIVEETKNHVYSWNIYSINGSSYFVSANHPFMSTKWRKSFDPEWSLNEKFDLPISQLEIGDVLVTDHGLERVNSFDYIIQPQTVYNFTVSGNHTYYADGYLVHNNVTDWL